MRRERRRAYRWGHRASDLHHEHRLRPHHRSRRNRIHRYRRHRASDELVRAIASKRTKEGSRSIRESSSGALYRERAHACRPPVREWEGDEEAESLGPARPLTHECLPFPSSGKGRNRSTGRILRSIQYTCVPKRVPAHRGPDAVAPGPSIISTRSRLPS